MLPPSPKSLPRESDTGTKGDASVGDLASHAHCGREDASGGRSEGAAPSNNNGTSGDQEEEEAEAADSIEDEQVPWAWSMGLPLPMLVVPALLDCLTGRGGANAVMAGGTALGHQAHGKRKTPRGSSSKAMRPHGTQKAPQTGIWSHRMAVAGMRVGRGRKARRRGEWVLEWALRLGRPESWKDRWRPWTREHHAIVGERGQGSPEIEAAPTFDEARWQPGHKAQSHAPPEEATGRGKTHPAAVMA